MDFLLSELPELPEVERVVSHWRAVDPTFSRAVGMGVRLSAALGRLGVQLGLQESWVDSLAVLRAAVALAPDESAHINNLAVMLERADQQNGSRMAPQFFGKIGEPNPLRAQIRAMSRNGVTPTGRSPNAGGGGPALLGCGKGKHHA